MAQLKTLLLLSALLFIRVADVSSLKFGATRSAALGAHMQCCPDVY